MSVQNEFKIPSSRRIFVDVDDVHLCCVDFGGPSDADTPRVLILHGLAGRANEWRSTARWLTQTHHVYALDQRGHGASDKSATDYSREAYVTDVIGVIEQLKLAPVVLIGQSMGGINASLVAARRPDLVCALVAIESSVSSNPRSAQSVREWLASWPLPFQTLADARAYFGGNTLFAETWIEVLEERSDGYWPQFNLEHMVASMADIVEHDYWAEWEQITCPTLVVGGAESWTPQQELQEMAHRIEHGRYAMVPLAGHDLHLEQPEAWRKVLTPFLYGLNAAYDWNK